MAKYNLGNNNDHLYATNFDDEIYGNGGADYIYALDGNDFVNGGTGDDSIAGGRGNDWLLGGEGNDTLNGEDGNDTLRDQAGNDTYYGGIGDDTLEGGFGDDHLYGGSGHDKLKLVGEGHAWMYGGTGNDIYDLGVASGGWERPSIHENAGEGYDSILFNGSWATGWGELLDSFTMPANIEELQVRNGFSAYGDGTKAKPVYGNELDNVISGSEFSDRLHGGRGNDTLVGNGGDDRLFGDEGNDTLIVAGLQGVTMAGGQNDDTYVIQGAWARFDGWQITETAGQGYDTLKVNAQVVTMPAEVERLVLLTGDVGAQVWGNGIANLVNGSTGADEVHGGGGDDLLYGYDGNDSLIGDAGHDLLAGGIGNDSLTGGSGNDALAGEAGHDELWGNDGVDRLDGGEGDDRLAGGAGTDELIGGAGSNTFYFASVADSPWNQRDRILDFKAGADTIDLRSCDAQPGTAGLQNWHLVPTFSGAAGELTLVGTQASLLIYGDTNGDKLVDFMVELVGMPAVSLADFEGVW